MASSSFSFYFNLFVQKILFISRIRTQIVRVEGEDADHKTTTTTTSKVFFSLADALLNKNLE